MSSRIAMLTMVALVSVGSLALPGSAVASPGALPSKVVETYRDRVSALAQALPQARRSGWTATILELLDEWSRGEVIMAGTIFAALKRSWANPIGAKAGMPQTTGVAILIDVSGSMANMPASGGSYTKLAGAEKAARAALAQLKGFAAAHPERALSAAVLTFSTTVKTRIPLQRVGPSFPSLPALVSESATAIGDGLIAARKILNGGHIGRQHIIVITDGQNSSGSTPLTVLRAFNLLPKEQFPRVHFVAFDIGQGVFRPLSLFLSKIHEAKDARQLDAVLSGLFSRDILPEATP